MCKMDLTEEFIRIRDNIIQNDLEKLNENQRHAVLKGEGPQIVIAGPGSGKTHVIMYRLLYLIKYGPVFNANRIPQDLTKKDLEIIKETPNSSYAKAMLHYFGIKAENILVITFTKSGADEMKARFLSLINKNNLDCGKVTFSTFHSIFFRILRSVYGYSLKEILTEDEKRLIIRRIAEELKISYDDEQEFITELQNEIGLIKNDLIDLSYYNSMVLPSEQFRTFFLFYEEYKRKNNKIDFDDMLYDCYDLLKTNNKVLDFWRNKFKYILIDEFQDINKVQYEVIKLLAAPNNNLFIVGDDDQSIYRFRGARPEFLLNFPKDFKDAGKVILNINYRSTKKIVSASNLVISNNKKRFKKKMESINDEGEEIFLIQSEDIENEAVNIADWISGCRKKSIDYKDIAVIFRTNLQARALVDIMLDLNMPFYLRDEISNIYEHWIAKDLIAYIKLSMDYYDNESAERILNKPKRYLSKGLIFEAKKEKGTLLDNLYYLPSMKRWQLEKLEELNYNLSRLKKKRPAEAITYIRKDIGYNDYILEYAQYRNIGVRGLKEVLDEIQEAAKSFNNYKDWLNHIENVGEEINKGKHKKGAAKEGITLTTMHGAKGLEYEAVCIAGAVEGIIPHYKSTSIGELEEERRLFYVGMTRAKRYLAISTVRKRYEEETKASRFIDEMIFRPSLNQFQKDTVIIHQKFGKGKITNLQGSIAEVKFNNDFFKRKINLEICIEKNIISIENFKSL